MLSNLSHHVTFDCDHHGVKHIQVKVRLTRLYDIDTIGKRFTCMFWVKMKWRVQKRFDDVDLSEEWIPKLSVLDHIGELFSFDKRLEKHVENEAITIITLRHSIHGVFPETFNLRWFPFDTQTPIVRLIFYNCNHSKSKGDVCEVAANTIIFDKTSHCIYYECFTQKDAWDLFDDVRVNNELSLSERNGYGIRHNMLCLSFTLTRKSIFFVISFMIPISLTTLLELLSFAMEIGDERLSICVTLILTLVALKFTASQHLPVLSYLTCFDAFLSLHFILGCTICIANVVVMYHHSTNTPIAIVCSGFWISTIIGTYCLLRHHKMNSSAPISTLQQMNYGTP
jgi:hypothetical protein